ncbi:MAG: hypothetical protein QGH66_07740, partial [Dehalococcoidia bacterium]|nr:hypothetical protein [Dehalococcoidia bacterium]
MLAGAIVVLASIFLVMGSDTIATKSDWGRMWVGSLLLAGATSLPEMATNVAAVRIGAPSLAAGNILGANMLNMVSLSALLALLGGRGVFQKLLRQQAVVAGVALVLTVAALFLIALQLQVKWLWVSPASVILIGGYIVGFRIIRLYSCNDTPIEAPGSSRTIRWGFGVFAVSAAVIVVATPLLASSARDIANLIGIAESFMGVLAVAMVTTLPELTVTVTALRLRAPNLAVASIYGSTAFNIAILGVADLFFTRGSLFGSLDLAHLTAALFCILLTGLGLAQLL